MPEHKAHIRKISGIRENRMPFFITCSNRVCAGEIERTELRDESND